MGAAGARDERACGGKTAEVGVFSAAQAAELERQGRAFELLAAVFGQKPSEGLLAALGRPEAAQVFEGAGADVPSDGGAVANGEVPVADNGPLPRALAELTDAWGRDPAATLDRLGDEYTVLLERPGARSAQPWGSCYLEADGALFGSETLAVRRAYAARGFLPSGYPHEADDHLAFELAFLAELTYAACDALDRGDRSSCDAALAERDAFATEHMRPWAERFSDELGASPLVRGARLYPQAAAQVVAELAAVGGTGR